MTVITDLALSHRLPWKNACLAYATNYLSSASSIGGEDSGNFSPTALWQLIVYEYTLLG